eukprot:CAMPEP_0113466902 /NCGR_PEP_ID=MMETSP0014_2-20120614/14527_1 /TAXON_ID=2857 /ORGANISM="Nitzschia sp." /LENGTH=300 /DNA_ID=CAMNT_0000359171 /DNA_START=933 /DNA_END=1835 /DNA_ORIENTATION=+ /assembly_acc=CAM_ASM_000159
MLVCPDCTTRFVLRLKNNTLMVLSRFFCYFCRHTSSRFNPLSKKGSSHGISATNEGSYCAATSTTTTRPLHMFEYLVLFECGLLLGSSIMALFVETFTMNLIAAAVTMQQSNAADAADTAAAAENEVDADGSTTSNTAETAEEGSLLNNNDPIVLLLPSQSLFKFVITNTLNTVACYAVLFIVRKHHCTTTSKSSGGRPGVGRRVLLATWDRVELVVESENGGENGEGDGEWWIGDTTSAAGSGDTESTTNSNNGSSTTDSSDSSISFHGDDQLDENVNDVDEEVDTSLQWLLRPTESSV